MAQDNLPRAQTVPEFWGGPEEEHRRKIAVGLNMLMRGVSNNHFKATLDPSETTTEVSHPPVRPGSGVQITPGSESAAASFATGAIWVETQQGKAIIHHDESELTDRIFHLAFFG
jgi:hypothetical protein